MQLYSQRMLCVLCVLKKNLKEQPKGRKDLLLKRHLNIPFELVNKSELHSQSHVQLFPLC